MGNHQRDEQQARGKDGAHQEQPRIAKNTRFKIWRHSPKQRKMTSWSHNGRAFGHTVPRQVNVFMFLRWRGKHPEG